MVGFVVGLELLREATWKKIIPNFLLPRVWAVGAFNLQVNCALPTKLRVSPRFLHECFGMFQQQRWFHSNQDGVFPRYEHMSMWLSLPAMHPLNDLVHSPVIVEADINRAISVSIAEPNKADYSMCHIISALWFSHVNVVPTSDGCWRQYGLP